VTSTGVSRGERRARTQDAATLARQNALALLPELEAVPVHRVYHWPLRLVISLLTLSMVLAIFGSFWGYNWWTREVGFQGDVDFANVLTAAETADFRAAAAVAHVPVGSDAEPVVLTYHDIGPNTQGSEYVVSPLRFAAQMAMLDAAGYRTMTAEEFTRYVRGQYTPPPRSVLITFDDGTRGLYHHADPVLEHYGFTAVSFIITGRVGTHRPYYLTWPQIDRMHDSGRWQFQSHTHDLHTKVPISETLLGSNLSNRLYHGDGRQESFEEFQARVTSDLEQSFRDFADHGLPRPTLFAWPFSDAGADEIQDVEASTFVQQQIRDAYDVSFVDNRLHPTPATRDRTAQEVVERFEVMETDTAQSVFRGLQRMRTLPVTDLRPTDADRTWLEPGGHPAPFDLHGDVVQADAMTLTFIEADWAVQRTSMWSDYAVEATVRGLASGRESGGLRVRVEHEGELALRVSAGRAWIEQGGGVLVEAPVSGGEHRLRVEVAGDETRAYVDGSLVGSVPAPTDPAAGRGGFGVILTRGAPPTPFPAFSAFQSEPL
jgi:poly-beta-1,6-N-acetyl-D-glucosamine N-deacetylase